jgi:hypothetical protein
MSEYAVMQIPKTTGSENVTAPEEYMFPFLYLSATRI